LDDLPFKQFERLLDERVIAKIFFAWRGGSGWRWAGSSQRSGRDGVCDGRGRGGFDRGQAWREHRSDPIGWSAGRDKFHGQVHIPQFAKFGPDERAVFLVIDQAQVIAAFRGETDRKG